MAAVGQFEHIVGWIHCHGSRATCHIAGCSHLAKSMSWSCHIIARCKNSIRHIENRFTPYFFLFLMQFGLWRSAAFISSPTCLISRCSETETASRPTRILVNLGAWQLRYFWSYATCHKNVTILRTMRDISTKLDQTTIISEHAKFTYPENPTWRRS